MPLYFFLYHGAKKSKMTKNSNQGGSCLNLGTGMILRESILKRKLTYSNHRSFHTRFIKILIFILLAESTKFSSTRKPFTYTSVGDTTLAVCMGIYSAQKFANAGVWDFYAYESYCDYRTSKIRDKLQQSFKFLVHVTFNFGVHRNGKTPKYKNGPVRTHPHSCEITTPPSHSMDRAGQQVKMASSKL